MVTTASDNMPVVFPAIYDFRVEIYCSKTGIGGIPCGSDVVISCCTRHSPLFISCFTIAIKIYSDQTY